MPLDGAVAQLLYGLKHTPVGDHDPAQCLGSAQTSRDGSGSISTQPLETRKPLPSFHGSGAREHFRRPPRLAANRARHRARLGAGTARSAGRCGPMQGANPSLPRRGRSPSAPPARSFQRPEAARYQTAARASGRGRRRSPCAHPSPAPPVPGSLLGARQPPGTPSPTPLAAHPLLEAAAGGGGRAVPQLRRLPRPQQAPREAPRPLAGHGHRQAGGRPSLRPLVRKRNWAPCPRRRRRRPSPLLPGPCAARRPRARSPEGRPRLVPPAGALGRGAAPAAALTALPRGRPAGSQRAPGARSALGIVRSFPRY